VRILCGRLTRPGGGRIHPQVPPGQPVLEAGIGYQVASRGSELRQDSWVAGQLAALLVGDGPLAREDIVLGDTGLLKRGRREGHVGGEVALVVAGVEVGMLDLGAGQPGQGVGDGGIRRVVGERLRPDPSEQVSQARGQGVSEQLVAGQPPGVRQPVEAVAVEVPELAPGAGRAEVPLEGRAENGRPRDLLAVGEVGHVLEAPTELADWVQARGPGLQAGQRLLFFGQLEPVGDGQRVAGAGLHAQGVAPAEEQGLAGRLVAR